MNISPKENITMAMSAVWTHRFRSGLTILGIVIGITTVVTVASLLTGLRAGIITFFDSLGPDNIFVSKSTAIRARCRTRRRSASAGPSIPRTPTPFAVMRARWRIFRSLC